MKPTKDDTINDLDGALKYLLAQLDDPSTNGLETTEAIANAYDVLDAHGFSAEWDNQFSDNTDEIEDVKY